MTNERISETEQAKRDSKFYMWLAAILILILCFQSIRYHNLQEDYNFAMEELEQYREQYEQQ